MSSGRAPGPSRHPRCTRGGPPSAHVGGSQVHGGAPECTRGGLPSAWGGSRVHGGGLLSAHVGGSCVTATLLLTSAPLAEVGLPHCCLSGPSCTLSCLLFTHSLGSTSAGKDRSIRKVRRSPF